MNDMNEPISGDFSRFFTEKLRPAIDGISARRRKALKTAVLAAGGVFLVMLVAVYLFFAPYGKMLGEYNISYWPLLLLLPATMAVIAFSIVYLLLLRSMFGEFRNTMVGRLAEFIDPGFIHQPGAPVSSDDLNASLLFGPVGKPASGNDLFRGRVGGFGAELAEIGVKGDDPLAGVFCSVRCGRRFKSFCVAFPEDVQASVSGVTAAADAQGYSLSSELVRREAALGMQALVPSPDQALADVLLSPGLAARLADMRHSRDVRLFLSFRDDRLWIALLTRRARSGDDRIFEGFDFAHSREFCLDAVFALDVLRWLQDRPEFWVRDGT